MILFLDHVCETCCQFIYGCLTVSDSVNGCWRSICLVFGTVALCDVLVRSILLTYLLTYFLKCCVFHFGLYMSELLSGGRLFVALCCCCNVVQQCAAGYSRVPDASLPLGRCVGCSCNGHATSCDPQTGHCTVRQYCLTVLPDLLCIWELRIVLLLCVVD